MKASTEEKKKRVDELTEALAAGASIAPDTPPDTTESQAKPRRSRQRSKSNAPKKMSGSPTTTAMSLSKQVTISLYQEDHQVIRELSAFLAAQGLEVNRSLLIKAALRAARPGNELLEGYNEARRLDKRTASKDE